MEKILYFETFKNPVIECPQSHQILKYTQDILFVPFQKKMHLSD